MLIFISYCPLSIGQSELPNLGEATDLELSNNEIVQLSKKIKGTLVREESYIDDWEINQYFQQILDKLNKDTDSYQANKLSAYVFNRKEVNAFATFGEQIGIFSGLMLLSNSEDEIAGVLAHELAHLRQGHLLRQQSKNRQISLSQIAGIVAAIIAVRSGNSQLPQAAIATTNAIGMQASLSYSREFEQEADRIGLQILNNSPYSPAALANFLQKMFHKYRANDNFYSEYIRTHPLTFERVMDLRQRIVSEKDNNKNSSTIDYYLIKNKLQVLSLNATEALNYYKTNVEQQENQQLKDSYYYGYALAHAKNQSWNEALAQLQKISSEVANNQIVINLKSHLLLQLNRVNGLKVYSDNYQKYPKNITNTIGYVQALQLNNKISQAIQIAENLVMENPDYLELYEMLAKLYVENKQNAMQHRCLARIHYLLGEYKSSVIQYNLAINSKDANYYQLAMINAELKVAEQEQLNSKNNDLD